jgi:hydroxyquinol 1,2-dioxygenase
MTRPNPQTELTQAVIDSIAKSPDPRFRQLMSTLITKLHEFIREADLTPEEWMAAIEFLTATGKTCTDKRQEFILLSDTLGASMQVVMLAQARASAQASGNLPATPATEATVQGPYYWAGAPDKALGSNIAEGVAGEPAYYAGQVTDTAGKPLAGALLDVWSGDGEGVYDMQVEGQTEMLARARFRTDAEGRYAFWSIRPSFYPIPMDGPVGKMIEGMGKHPNRPGHIHFMLSMPGHAGVTTHLFVANSPYLDSDVVFGVRDSLVVEFERHAPGKAPDGRDMNKPWWSARHDFRLAPARP